MKPNVFLIGVQKAGTTSLYDWLSQHPDIYAPDYTKDLPFFIYEELYSKGKDYFLNLFEEEKLENCKVVIAGSVNYIYYHSSAERIYKFNPNSKLILILRNPIERAISAYYYAVERGIEDRDINTAFSEELEKGSGNIYTNINDLLQKDYIGHGFYARQIKNFLKYFPKDSIFIGLYEHMKENPIKFFKEVLEFLEITDKVKINYTHKNKTGGAPRSKMLAKILYHKHHLDNGLIRFVKRMIPLKMKYRIVYTLAEWNKKEGKKELPNRDIIGKLINIYKDEIHDLESIVNFDLTFWLEKYK